MIVGLGIDLVDVARIRREVERRGDSVLEEILTPVEMEYCRGMAKPYPSIAARFAAKEALFKALGSGKHGTMHWHDLEVSRNGMGKPDLVATGSSGEAVRALKADRIHLSLTHTDEHALAAVLLESLDTEVE
jgi:holo-[acyl-carrier protein] synthase